MIPEASLWMLAMPELRAETALEITPGTLSTDCCVAEAGDVSEPTLALPDEGEVTAD